jgi:hypothetical protein
MSTTVYTSIEFTEVKHHDNRADAPVRVVKVTMVPVNGPDRDTPAAFTRYINDDAQHTAFCEGCKEAAGDDPQDPDEDYRYVPVMGDKQHIILMDEDAADIWAGLHSDDCAIPARQATAA